MCRGDPSDKSEAQTMDHVSDDRSAWHVLGCPQRRPAARALPVPAGPRGWPLVGNLREFEGGLHGEAFLRCAAQCGGIFSLRPPAAAVTTGTGALGRGQPMVFLTDPALLEEFYTRSSDFQKRTLKYSPEVRTIAADGLFTSDDDEPIHDQAARILLPAFSMSGMKEYFGMVTSCTALLCNRFEEHAKSGELLDLHPLLSQYTLEVIGRVAFGVDFGAMSGDNEFLRLLNERNEISLRMQRSSKFATVQAVKAFLNGDLAALKRNREALGRFVWDVVSRKKQTLEAEASAGADAPRCPVAGLAGRCPVKDMAERMLTQPDPKTGEKLPDSNIEGQVVTFLIAGHDSTSSALTCLIYNLALNPHVEERVYREVMEVVGPTEPLTWEHLGRLTYCLQVIKENLRLWSPANTFTKTSPPDRTTTLGPYEILPGTDISVPIWALHRNPSVWPNPNKFDPDRFSEEQAAGRSPYAWLPFSYGKRGCIGQQLSLIEQRVALVELVRRFHVRVDPSSNLTLEEPLFLDPQGIFVSLTLRSRDAVPVTARTYGDLNSAKASGMAESIGPFPELSSKQSLVLFGSNMGTCEELAEKVLAQELRLGMEAGKAALNDLAAGSVSLSAAGAGTLTIVASSYNGQPPENATDVEQWLETEAAQTALRGVPFAIFGSGNKQWAATYMAFPRRLQAKLESLGAVPLVPLGEGDMDGGEIEGTFDSWSVKRTVAWLQYCGLKVPAGIEAAMQPKFPIYDVMLQLGKRAAEMTSEQYQRVVDESLGRLQCLALKGYRPFLADVSCNRELVSGGERSTRHLELALPEDVTYRPGDHLGVMGANPNEVVAEYLHHFGMKEDAVVVLDLATSQGQSMMPLHQPLDLWSVFAYFVELQQPPSRAMLQALSAFAKSSSDRDALEHLALPDSEAYMDRVLQRRLTPLEVLQEFPSVDVPLGALIGMLPSMRPRYYSVSSSPQVGERQLSITVGVVQGVAPSGRVHRGVCSNHLKSTPRCWPGAPDQLLTVAFVKDTGAAFRLPVDSATPVIMVGPGTGLAPMRGFLQERVANGATENVLFFGCRDEGDFLYREELESFAAAGDLKLHVAFSRKACVEKTYVQDLIAREAASLGEMLARGAHVYVCGDASAMAPAVRAAFAKMLGGAAALEAMISASRYCEDVWAAQSV